jgi:isopentenyl phosphate kinase
MIPVVYGDTVFDTVRGGTILSTEDLFVHLAGEIKAQSRVLLAGLEEGLWEDFPQRTKLIRSFNVTGYPDSKVEFIQGSLYPDVTGGMREKVRLVSDLICQEKIDSALIFSGEISLNVKNALLGETPGTILVSGTNR